MSGFVLGPQEGPAYGFYGAHVVIKASAAHTGGQLGVMESLYPSRLVVSPHLHAGEDEMFYLLAGELTGFCDDDWIATPGSFVFVPRDCCHGFAVTSAAPARALVITGPSRLAGEIAAAGQPPPLR